MGSESYFNNVAGEWDRMRQSFFSENVRLKACETAGITCGRLVADIGAGTGFISEEALKRGADVIAVDMSENMLEVLETKFGKNEHFEYRSGDAMNIPIESGSVDAVLANMCLHHVEVPSDAIRDMARTLKSGGKLVITDLDEHHNDFLLREHHDRWAGFRMEEVLGWFRDAGLSDVRIEDIDKKCSASSCCCSDSASISIFLAYGVKI